MDTSDRPALLAIADGEAAASTLREALLAAGLRTVAEASCFTLGQQIEVSAPEVIVCHLPEGAHGLLLSLAPYAGRPPCPVLVFAPLRDAAQALALAQAGIDHWQPELPATGLAQVLAFAQSRRRLYAQSLEETEEVKRRLDERRWVDRAKGLLMAARGIDEDEAFGLLRSGAMHANQRLADLARSVVDAARWADAVNRSGQLRMLSQRAVAAAAQRLARVNVREARKVQTQALQRAQANLDHLRHLPLASTEMAALDAAQDAWRALIEVLQLQLQPELLKRADASAETALRAGEALTAALEAQGACRGLRVVNLCGRQRMLTQRLVKAGLLAALGSDAGAALQAQQTIDAFGRAMDEIESLPLSTPGIHAALAQSKACWVDLLGAVRADDLPALVEGGQALLQSLETLTAQSELGVQALLA